MPTEELNQTILIIDDAKENIITLCQLLKDTADVIFATNGKDGLIKAKSDLPDLILLDISMPEMNGFDVLRYLKEDPDTEEIPVIFVSGIPDSYNEARGLTLGAVDYIKKPFSPAVVRARINIQLKWRHLIKKLESTNQELTMEVLMI